jgi:hypothetical protein
MLFRAETINRNHGRSEMNYGSAFRIYSVLCPSFHGATLLSLLLGNHSNVLSLGDTVATKLDHHCGCGSLVSDCPFWQQVGLGWQQPEVFTPIPPRPELFASPPLNQAVTILCGLAASKLGLQLRFGSFSKAFAHQLSVCRRFAEFEVFIDGYKSVSRYCAAKAAGFPIEGVIHILRDPRAFAASSKQKSIPVRQSVAQWASAHATISRVTRMAGERVIQVRYEELCASPEEQLLRLQSWMQLEPEPLLHAFPPGRHWVGNRTLRTFDGEVALREGWRSALAARELAEVERICGREALKFGYDLTD